MARAEQGSFFLVREEQASVSAGQRFRVRQESGTEKRTEETQPKEIF